MNILWFVSSLEQKGGGERFVLEAVNALKAQGHAATIVCDRLAPAASFDGRYDLQTVVCLSQDHRSGASYLGAALRKAAGVFSLFAAARSLKPDVIICQSEFDAIKVRLVARLLGCRYRVFVFGQMYQFRTDISKYASIFRRHIPQIVASRPGYRDTVIDPPPKLSPPVWLANELVSRLKFAAIHAADAVFTLSDQVRWEVSLLYAKEAQVLRAAFDEGYLDEAALAQPRPVKPNPVFVSVSRLADKKRIELTIGGFSRSGINGQLRIVGSGPEEERLKALASASSGAEKIVFLGGIDDAALARELEGADCFVSMDIGDFDISVVEAMGKGRRVIVASDFDMKPFGEDFTGVTVVAPEVDAIAAVMQRIEKMAPPSTGNLPALHQLTWQWLAQSCVA